MGGGAGEESQDGDRERADLQNQRAFWKHRAVRKGSQREPRYQQDKCSLLDPLTPRNR